MPDSLASRLCRLRERDRSRGAAAVEAAIVLPVVLALFIGMIEFGLIFKDLLAISAATQAAARTASMEPTLQTGNRFAVDAASQAAGGVRGVRISGDPVLYVYDPVVPDPDKGCSRKCLKFVWNVDHFDVAGGSWNPCTLKATDVAVMFVVQHRGLIDVSYASPRLVQSATYRFDPLDARAVCQ